MDPLLGKLFKCSSEQRMSPHIIPSPISKRVGQYYEPWPGNFHLSEPQFLSMRSLIILQQPLRVMTWFRASITPRIVWPVTFLKDIFDSNLQLLSSHLGDPCSISRMPQNLWSWSGPHLKDATVTSDLLVSCPGNELTESTAFWGSVSQPDRGTAWPFCSSTGSSVKTLPGNPFDSLTRIQRSHEHLRSTLCYRKMVGEAFAYRKILVLPVLCLVANCSWRLAFQSHHLSSSFSPLV